MPSFLHELLQAWQVPWLLTATLALVAAAYIRGWTSARSRAARGSSGRALVAFLSGIAVVWIALASPLAVFAHWTLTGHMVQHLLLMVVAAPLLLLGSPALLFGVNIRNPSGGLLTKLGRALTHPAFCLLAPSITLLAWHVPVLFELAMRSAWWHGAQQASFFATGVLLWWPVVQPSPSVARWPRWTIPLYLFFATMPCDALAAFLTFYDRAIYAPNHAGMSAFPMSAMADQQLAGSLMWVWVTIAYLLPAALITIQVLSPTATTRPAHAMASVKRA
jgi:cytochrome c oxidase assembly factor CtaG